MHHVCKSQPKVRQKPVSEHEATEDQNEKNGQHCKSDDCSLFCQHGAIYAHESSLAAFRVRKPGIAAMPVQTTHELRRIRHNGAIVSSRSHTTRS